MKEKKKLIVSLIIIVVIGILTVLLVFALKRDEEEVNNPGNNSVDVGYENYELLRDSNVAFTLQSIINEYYGVLKSEDSSDIIAILDDNYETNKNINKSNVLNVVNNNFYEVQYIIKMVHYFKNDQVIYYLVEGYSLNQNYDDVIDYSDNVNYFVTLNISEKTYVIYPLDNDVDLNVFVNNYNYTKDSAMVNKYRDSNISDENKLKLYINNFLNLMYFDTAASYEMLGKQTQKYFGSVTEFASNIDYIYDLVSTSIFSYALKKNDSINTYYIKDDNQNSITIVENGAMNYTIDIEF